MSIEYKDGAIVSACNMAEKCIYDVSNDSVSVTFNGNGGITKYTLVDDATVYDSQYMNLKIYVDEMEIPFNTVKRVAMLGRKQEISFEYKDTFFRIILFTDHKNNGVFERISCSCKEEKHIRVCLFMRGAIDDSFENASENSAFFSKNLFGICSSSHINVIKDIEAVDLLDRKVCGETSFDFAYSFKNDSYYKLISLFDDAYNEVCREIEEIKLPSNVNDEISKALYYSSYFCSLQNYKEKGLFKGFMAGRNYLSPARTYFRDSYYTVLPMYNGHCDKVKNQILTLSRCIRQNGSCPSAVRCDFTEFWGNHYDSPSLYCMMIYDYINNTGDFSILKEEIDGKKLSEIFETVIEYMISLCDSTGLVVKSGRFNRLDWSDEVCRYGYVTYDNILFARALFCASKILKNNKYEKLFENTVKAINDILWNEEKGYYINYKNEDLTEDNLAIDTVFAVIFGIADKARSVRLLDNIRNILETRNNRITEDFGVMCVYPFYSDIHASINNSSFQLHYQNGADWPYLSAMYAYALKMMNMDYDYPLTRWFEYNISKGNFTPIEYYSPYCEGSLLQGWSGVSAFVLYDEKCTFFNNKI